MAATKLYFVSAYDTEDTNLDLFVEAPSPEEVRPLWEAWALGYMDDIEDVTYRVWEVPTQTGAPVAHEWPSVLIEEGT